MASNILQIIKNKVLETIINLIIKEFIKIDLDALLRIWENNLQPAKITNKILSFLMIRISKIKILWDNIIK